MSGDPLPPGSTLGILGGGQLGRMLAMAAARLGYRTVVLDPDPDAPASQVASHHVAAKYEDAAALEALAACDAVTYEFENVPVAAVEALAERTRVAPSARSLRTAQDRRIEKRAIEELGLAVAPWRAVNGWDDLAAARADLGDVILKTARGGYDGKGQRSLASDAPDENAAAALDALGGRHLVAERRVPLDAELSVIAVRGRAEEAIAFDASRNVHENGILRRSAVPAGLGAREQEARDAALRIAEGLGHVGALGVEFFVSSGRLLVNEIAPRVHNSGHWTEAACAIDQFEAHIRAVAGLPLGDGARHSDAVMENLLGDEIERVVAAAADPTVRVHLYGKAETRPGRKMGHWTRIAPFTR